MHMSKGYQSSGSLHRLYHQPEQVIDPFYTLDSSMDSASLAVYDSPAVSFTSNKSPFSPQGSLSSLSDPPHSSENTYGSPFSGSSIIDDDNEMKQKLRELEITLLGPAADTVDSHNCCFDNGIYQAYSANSWHDNQMMEVVSRLGIGGALMHCAQAMYDNNLSTAVQLMHVLERVVSVSGEPIQRLGAYMLEGLRARMESSGSQIYKALKCEEPTSSELMSYMSILYQICPYWKFAYTSANVVIKEVIEYEPSIHIIDFQIAQGTQWMMLMSDLARRSGGPPRVRITGIDDSQSAHARGGGLDLVGKRLSDFASSRNVPFEFCSAGMCGSKVERGDLNLQPGEALAVNFPFVLHHMPDESVSTCNHRDRLLRLVKSLSPKVVTLIEQESNTNTSPFNIRFHETLDYYSAMFESIDAASRPRDDKQRISAEQNCVARDIVNMIACEGAERVERHELLGKWRSRLMMDGFTPYSLGASATVAVKDLLKDYSDNYRLAEKDGALYLGWKDRTMATSSAWK